MWIRFHFRKSRFTTNHLLVRYDNQEMGLDSKEMNGKILVLRLYAISLNIAAFI